MKKEEFRRFIRDLAATGVFTDAQKDNARIVNALPEPWRSKLRSEKMQRLIARHVSKRIVDTMFNTMPLLGEMFRRHPASASE